jgi:folylpolyglutamate synthase/dihydropteroate synthase
MQPRIKTMTAKTRNNDKALAAFMTSKAEIDTMLTRLQTLSDEHFNANPEDIRWGHAGDLADMAKNLREITDRAFQEGEYVERAGAPPHPLSSIKCDDTVISNWSSSI